ncbi:MAG: ROK family protein [Spirochaetales bacterium]|nr:ROK family protein [Spirochaetales bacterium]
MNYYAGIDLGGSSAKIGVIDENGKIIAKKKTDIDRMRDFHLIADKISDSLKSLLVDTAKEIKAIGIGTPGFINKQTGMHEGGSANLPMLPGNNIVGEFKDKFRLPVYADNDATCATAGEHIFGAGRNFTDFILLTLGTGIGGGLVLDGKLYTGKIGFAGEIGHMSLDPDGPLCNCGNRGCFEQYSSGPAMVKSYREKLKKRNVAPPDDLAENNARLVLEKAAQGDSLAMDVVFTAAGKLAQAIGSLINILNIEACLIGGGISRAGDLLLKPVRSMLPDFVWPPLIKNFVLQIASLQNDAGIIGAAAIAKISLQS